VGRAGQTGYCGAARLSSAHDPRIPLALTAMPRPKLLAIGGAHVDRRGQVSGIYVPGASNPGHMSEDIGGGVFNALRNAVQRGVDASLMSVRGADAAGENVARTIGEAGIRDLSVVFLDRASPSYTALIDRDGEVIAGLADMALYELAFARQLRRSKAREEVAAADAILTDANLPADALARVAELAGGKPLFAVAISPAKVVRLQEVLPRLTCLFMNLREAAGLAATGADGGASEIAARLRAAGLGSGVVTDGGNAVTGFDADGIFAIMPPKPTSVADATGAGDALAGATVAAMMYGKPLRQALREGIAAALLTIGSPKAVAAISDKALAETLELVPQPQAVA
jgi:sugar/nucleoside kinase (ribokinase family)